MKLPRRKRIFPQQGLPGTLISLILGTVMLCRSHGTGITLAWDPSPGANVIGYAVYCGVISKNYTQRLDVGMQTSAVLTNLNAGMTYYFVVTAHASNGAESLPSNEISYAVPSIVAGQTTAPYISKFAITALGASLTWTSLPGMAYRVLYRHNLSDTQWITASPVLLAASNSLQWVDSVTVANGQRFYSVVLLPTNATAITAAPYISDLNVTAFGAKLTWKSVPGQSYRVVYKKNLRDTYWANTSPDIFASGNSLQWIDIGAATNNQRFYAVVLLP